MIKYTLKCAGGHQYETWFASSSAYDALSSKGQLQCPVCGTSDVGKALMTPNVSARQNKRETHPAASPQPKTVTTSAEGETPQTEAIEMMRKLRDFVKENSEYVGPKFAEEARKIHYEEAETRSIYGEASGDELTDLHDEGIGFYPLPVLPEDHK
ncbi:MAG TPA: DUF1178 family protein [Hyphomicrobiales bacterium]|nr:DUF1178 family protein [Hyphomicrobiales bacterium]